MCNNFLDPAEGVELEGVDEWLPFPIFATGLGLTIGKGTFSFVAVCARVAPFFVTMSSNIEKM